MLSSQSGEAKDVDNYIEILERVLFAKVAVVFGVPEARSTHVKSTVSFLKNNHVRSKFELFGDILEYFYDHFRSVIAQFLTIFWVIDLTLEGLKNQIVYFGFNFWAYIVETSLLSFDFGFLIIHYDLFASLKLY